MTIETIPAFITTVGPNHTIVLPDNIAVGATVAVVLMSSTPQVDPARQARFATTLAAIRAAVAAEGGQPSVTDEDLETLIKEARQAA